MDKQIRCTISLACFLYMLINIIVGFDSNMIPFSIIVLLVINFYMLMTSRNNMMFLFVAFVIAYSNYSIVYANFINVIEEETWTEVITSRVTNESLNILVCFNYCLLWAVQWHRIKPLPSNNIFVESGNSNIFIVVLLSLALLFIFRYGYTIPTDEGARGETSAMYEYSIILFILLFYYCGNNRKIVFWILLLVFIFSIQGFVFGGRIEGIQLLLVAYFMFFMDKIRKRIVLELFVGMFLLMSIIGAVRGELLSGNFDVVSILFRIVERGFTLDTSYAAYYCSESFVYIRNLFSNETIFDLFLTFLESLVLGGGAGSDASLPAVSANYVNHNGGGILPFYFYFYLGLIGILISSFIVGAYLNGFLKMNEKSRGLIKCLMVLITCSVFRWYLYSPLMLLRGAMFMVIAYYGLYVFNNLTKPSLNKKNRKKACYELSN